MKKNYEKPLAKKVTFNYQKVVASSQKCVWHTPMTHDKTGCYDTPKGMVVSYLALDEDGCGWFTPDHY